MHKGLADVQALFEDVFNFVWLNILTLRQLEYWLFPVNDLQGSSLEPLANVSGVKPTLVVNNQPARKFNLRAHLNRDKIESNLSVPGIQGCHENALFKSFETSPHLICLYASTNIPLGPA